MSKETEDFYEKNCRKALQNGDIQQFKVYFSRWFYWYKLTPKSTYYYGVYKFFEKNYEECIKILDSSKAPVELRVYAALAFLARDDYDNAIRILDGMRLSSNDIKTSIIIEITEAIVYLMRGDFKSEKSILLNAINKNKSYAIGYLRFLLSSVEDSNLRSRLEKSFSKIINNFEIK